MPDTGPTFVSTPLLSQLQISLGGTYTFDRELGGGGMSRVFLAEETRLGRKVVVKVLAPELAAGVSSDRFEREIRLAARLQHPHIVPVLAAGDLAGLPYYAMPFVEGASLRQRLGERPFTIAQAVPVLRDVAEALAYAHKRGIVHRDIKPENVLLTDGAAVVTDFGIAKALASARDSGRGTGDSASASGAACASPSPSTLTALGTAIGTPAYMAPEQIIGDPVDHRADLYAWGVMAYELLAGRHPFSDRSGGGALIAAHLTLAPVPLAEVAPAVPPSIEWIVMRCLAKDASGRPSSALELVQALSDSAAERSGVVAAPAPAGSAPGRRRRRTVGPAAVLGAALLAGGYLTIRAAALDPSASLVAAGKLRAQERLLVADFQVRGADSALGGVVAEAVRANLAESRAIAVVPASTITGTLQRMQRPPSSRLDLALANEVAQRIGVKAIVGGQVTPLGGGYVVVVRLVTAGGDELASVRETVDGLKDLIPAIDRLSRLLRGRIGESLAAVEAAPRLEEVTTASLEALRKYAAGVRANDVEADFEKAVALLREALAIDTAFAMAYRKLGLALGNQRQPSGESADSAYEMAYRHRNRLSERERLLATADYFRLGPSRDRAKAIAAYEAVLEITPHDFPALNGLAILLRNRRDFTRAESTAARAVAADSNTYFGYTNLAIAQINQGKWREAAATAARLQRSAPRIERHHRIAYLSHAARRQYDSAAVYLARMRAGNDEPLRTEGLQGLTALAVMRGQLGDAARLRREGPPNVGARRRAVLYVELLDSARMAIWVRGDPERAIRILDATMAARPLRSLPRRAHQNYLAAASLYAVAGKPASARRLLAAWDAQVDSAARRVNANRRDHVLAEIALAERRLADAVTLFRSADRLPDGPADECLLCLPANLGRAFASAGMADSAIANWERYVNTPYHLRLLDDVWYLALAYRQLAELYAARGDHQRASAYAANLAELRRDADPALRPVATPPARQAAVR